MGFPRGLKEMWMKERQKERRTRSLIFFIPHIRDENPLRPI